jgi:hypothetical protein
MGLLDFLSGTQESTTKTDSSTSSKTTLPSYIKDASKTLVKQAVNNTQEPFEAYKGDAVAGPTADQTLGFDMINDFVTGGDGSELLDQVRQYSTAPAQQISDAYAGNPAQNVDFYSLIDPNSPLGGIEGYMNPYNETVLQNTLQQIYDAADQVRKRTNASATSAGAFGDARHGIVESLNNLNTSRAVGETSGNLLKEMYDTMMGWRSSDLGRLYNTDIANAGFNETALERLFKSDAANAGFNEQALSRLASGSAQEQNMMLQQLATLLGSGEAQRSIQNEGNAFDYQEFLRKQGWDDDQLRLAASVLGGVPRETSTSGTSMGTTVQETPDNSLWQLAGTLAGAAFAPMTGGASLALSPLASGASVGPNGIVG